MLFFGYAYVNDIASSSTVLEQMKSRKSGKLTCWSDAIQWNLSLSPRHWAPMLQQLYHKCRFLISKALAVLN